MNAHSTDMQNLALVQTIYGEFARGDIAAILSHGTDDIVWISGGSREDFPTLGERHGTEGAASFFSDVAAHDEFTSFEPREFLAGDGKVVAMGHYGITVKTTGKHFESDWVHVFTIVGGRIAKFQEFTDTAAFLKAGRG